MNNFLKNRAYTPEQKRLVMNGLWHLWILLPEQRLGQLIDNSMCRDNNYLHTIFSIEDFELLRSVDRFVAAWTQPSSEETKQYPETD